MKILQTITACALMALVTASCEHKDLCFNHSHIGTVTVTFDWRNAPSANPETMSLYLYPKAGGVGQRYDFVGRDGGRIQIAEGEYRAVCINSDTHKIILNQPSNATYTDGSLYRYFSISTETASLTYNLENITEAKAASAPRAKGSETERVAYTPEVFYTDTQLDVVIRNTDADQVITLYPQQASCTYSVQLQNIQNANYIYEMSATLSGMAGGMYVAERTPTDEVVTFPFAISFDKDAATGSGSLNTFGDCDADTQHTHNVVLYAVMNDGSTYYYSVDVTDQVHNAPDPYNVVISLDGIPFPEPASMSGQSSISVDSWESVITQIVL